jgi:hypothetical protein
VMHVPENGYTGEMYAKGVRCLLVTSCGSLGITTSGGRSRHSGVAECSTRKRGSENLVDRILVHGAADAMVYWECAHRVSVEREFQTTTIRNLNSKIDSRAFMQRNAHSGQLTPSAVCCDSTNSCVYRASDVPRQVLMEWWHVIAIDKKWTIFTIPIDSRSIFTVSMHVDRPANQPSRCCCEIATLRFDDENYDKKTQPIFALGPWLLRKLRLKPARAACTAYRRPQIGAPSLCH